MANTFVTQQFATLAVAVTLGVIVGIVFEIVDVFRQLMRLSFFKQLIIDILFCISMTALVFYTLLLHNWGEVRVHIFLGMAAGGLLYYLVLHRFFRRQLVWIFKKTMAAARFIARPFIAIAKFTAKIVKRVAKIMARLDAAGQQLLKKIMFPRKKKE